MATVKFFIYVLEISWIFVVSFDKVEKTNIQDLLDIT